MGKNNKTKKAIQKENTKPMKKISKRKRNRKERKQKQPKVDLENEEEEQEDNEIDLEYNEDEEDCIPEEYRDYLMYDDDIENAPHDPFDIYTIPNTKEEHSLYLKDLIAQSNIIIEVIDARNPEAFRNKAIEQQITSNENKTLLLLFNKIDLISDNNLKSLRNYYEHKEFTIFTSACNREKLEEVINDLKKLVQLHRKKKKVKHAFIQIGLIGYPNTGKESIINGLKLLGFNDPPNHTQFIYFGKKQTYGIDIVPGTILADEIEEAKENYSSIIPKSTKDINLVTSPQLFVKDLLFKISAQTIKGVYLLKEDIKSIDDLLKAISKKFSLDKVDMEHKDKFDKAALIIIKDIINGKLTYEVNIN